MYRTIPVILALFCGDIALSGEFAEKFQPQVNAGEKIVQALEKSSLSPEKKMMAAKLQFRGTLTAMNSWLENANRLRQARAEPQYQMDDADNVLYGKVKNLAQ